jgi:hypothetical protein
MICARCNHETRTLFEGICQECRYLTLKIQAARKPLPIFIITDRGIKIKPIARPYYENGYWHVRGFRWKRWWKNYSRHSRMHTFNSYVEDISY